MDQIRLRTHLRQNAHQLFAVQHHVVGPFDPGRNTVILPQNGHNAVGRRQRHHGSLLGHELRPQHQTHENPGASGGIPASSPASPARALHIRHDQMALRRAFLRLLLGPHIGRVRYIIDLQASTHPAGGKRRCQILLPQNIRALHQMIPPAGYRINDIALFPQGADDLPHRCPGYPKLFAQFLPGHKSIGILQHFQNLVPHVYIPPKKSSALTANAAQATAPPAQNSTALFFLHR